jgi:hypothetical protein
MSKTKHIESREYRELSVEELDLVSGGTTDAHEAAEAAKTLEAFAKAIKSLQSV